MTEQLIEETEAEEFADELSDEALDREGERRSVCLSNFSCAGR